VKNNMIIYTEHSKEFTKSSGKKKQREHFLTHSVRLAISKFQTEKHISRKEKYSPL
jgi:hypothetical protein